MSERYRHHLSLPEIGKQGQEKLSRARIAIIGIGGLGCPAALYLAAAGVGHLTLIDDDSVELSNLQRQVLFNEHDLGKKKAFVAADKLKKLNSTIEVKARTQSLNCENVGMIDNYDLIIDGTDNYATKYLLNDFCYFNDKPLILAAIAGFQGLVATIHPGQGCYRCLFPQRPSQNTGNCSESGVIGALPGIMGTLQSLEAIKLITEIECEKNFHKFDFISLEKTSFSLSKDSECQLCGSSPTMTSINESRYAQRIPSCRWLQFEEIPSSAVTIDIRTPQEFAQGHISGAINLPLSDLPSEELTGREVVIYCQTGRRCEQVWPIVKSLPAVKFLRGGFEPLARVREP